jgi:rhamnogalacturonyl hydrolase YesR
MRRLLLLLALPLSLQAEPALPSYLPAPFDSRFAPAAIEATLRAVAASADQHQAAAPGLLNAGLQAAAQALEDPALAKVGDEKAQDDWQPRIAAASKERAEAVAMVALMPKLEGMENQKSWSDPDARVFAKYERRKLTGSPDAVVAGLVTYATAWGMSRNIVNLPTDAFRLAIVQGWLALSDRAAEDGSIKGARDAQEAADIAGAILLAGSTVLEESHRMASGGLLPFVNSPRYQADLAHQREVLANPPLLNRETLMAAMRRATEWQQTSLWQVSGATDSPDADRSWYRGVFYAGMIPAYEATGDAYYLEKAKTLTARTGAKPGPGALRAPDCLAISQTYLDLYEREPDPALLEPTKAQADAILADPSLREPGGQYVDLVFVGAPTWGRLGRISGDARYFDYARAMWTKSRARFFDPKDHLFVRDDTWLPQENGLRILERNGRPVYWARGMGWAIGGLARLLETLPKDDPQRAEFEADFRKMAAALVACQGADGMWRASLFDPDSYPMGETSATALIAYGLLWGINQGILDRSTYLPPAEKAMRALLAIQEPDGKLGYVQPGAESPRVPVYRASNVEYATGALLLAAVEMLKLLR